MADGHNDKYSAPSGPPPGYGTQIQSPQHTGSSYPSPYTQNASMIPYQQQQQYSQSPPPPQQQHDMRAPDPVYGPPQGAGYQSPPVGGYYGPPNPQNNVYGQPGYGPPPNGYYGPPQQQMYYAAPGGPPAGYYQDSRGGGAGGGICAGILAAFACCCCLDFLF